MSEPTPYLSLPGEWANKAHCPVCNTSPMDVVHRADAPDLMACPRCHSLFEIEENGTRIHLISLPGILASQLTGQWVSYAEVKQSVQVVIAQQAAAKKAAGALTVIPVGMPAQQPVEKAPASPEPSPFTEELVETVIPSPQVEEKLAQVVVPPVQLVPAYQSLAPEIKDVRITAKDLYALGNSPEQIKAILSQDASLDIAEIQAVVDDLSGEEAAKKRRQRTWMWVSIGIGLFILILCIGIALMWQTMLGKLDGGTGINTFATSSANKTVVPLMATPIVVEEKDNGAVRPACPQTKEQASALFGGSVDSWFADTQDRSWFLVTRTPVAVHVPGGMNAVLINIVAGRIITVPGPASINNTTSLSILCR